MAVALLCALAGAIAGLVALPAVANAAVDPYQTTLLPTAGSGSEVVLSPDGTLLAEYQGSGVVGIYATATDTEITTFTATSATVETMAFWSDYVLVLGEDDGVDFVTAPSGFGVTSVAPRQQTVSNPYPVTDVAPVSTSRAYVIEKNGTTGTIGVADLSAPTAVTPLSLPDSYTAIATTPAASGTLYALTTATTGSASVETIPTTGTSANTVTRTVPLNTTTGSGPNVARSLAISPDGTRLFVGEDQQLVGISTSTWVQATTTLPTADEGYPPAAAPFTDTTEPTSCDSVDVSSNDSTVYCTGGTDLFWFSAATLTYDGGYALSDTAPANSAVVTGQQAVAATGTRVYAGLQDGGVASIPVATVLAAAAIPQGTAPGAPTNLTAVAGSTDITASWAVPADNGGQPITGYTVTAKPITGYGTGGTPIYDATSTWSTCKPGGTATSCTITGLDKWTPYDVTVVASNVLGDSLATSPVRVTTSVPTVPQNVGVVPGTVTTVGNASTVSVGVTWTPPVTGGGGAVVGYYVCADPSGAATPTCGAGYPTDAGSAKTVAATAASGGTAGVGNAVSELVPAGTQSVTLPNLTLGKTYLVTVTAYNVSTCSTSDPACGTNFVTGNALGQVSTPVTIIAGAPSQPTGLTATTGNQTVTLTWKPPANAGSPAFSSYTAQLNPGGINCPTALTAAALTCTFTGLTNGTAYTASVSAVNTNGAGPAATLANVTPSTLPGAPTITGVSFSGNSAVVTWTAPANTGGSPVTDYTVTARAGTAAPTCTTTGLTCTIAGLVTGQTYSFTVVATTKAGNGPASPNYTATLAGAPSAITGVTAKLVGRTLRLSWAAPATTGSASIVSYDVVATSAADDEQCTTTGATTCTITKLQVGQSYSVVVFATNSGGYQSTGSTAIKVKPVATPKRPTLARKKRLAKHHANVTVRWKPVPGATGYTVQRTGGPMRKKSRRAGAKARTLLFADLPRGRYQFVVAATTAHGRSVFSGRLTVQVR